ncbi:hypothetical protein SRO_4813 [Streptomyces rochei]|nr:hypothetical protein SRO_4813 [Streptomyces rochei]
MTPAPGKAPMSRAPGNSIRIGGDASGPVVAGNDNRVEVPQAAPEAAGPVQNNTADGHGTVYTVMNGDLHVHHEPPDET